jgi:endonuclease/exonuclease/phosphatase family metal-dependent hydrolase
MSFTLIAIWACRVGNRTANQYIGQVNQALLSHPQWLSKGPVVLAGDFNSNQIWDPKWPLGNHSSVVRLLEKSGIVSGYHRFFMEEQGNESHPTAYLYRHQTKPYHIDYIFIPEKWAPAIKSVEIGEFSTWSRHSDHCPMIVDLADIEQS